MKARHPITRGDLVAGFLAGFAFARERARFAMHAGGVYQRAPAYIEWPSDAEADVAACAHVAARDGVPLDELEIYAILAACELSIARGSPLRVEHGADGDLTIVIGAAR